MTRRRITVHDIPEPIRQALLADFKRNPDVSINDLVAGMLAARYSLETRFGGGKPRGTDCEPLILKCPEPIFLAVKAHAMRIDASLRAVVIDTVARHYNLEEFSVPLTRERTYQA